MSGRTTFSIGTKISDPTSGRVWTRISEEQWDVTLWRMEPRAEGMDPEPVIEGTVRIRDAEMAYNVAFMIETPAVLSWMPAAIHALARQLHEAGDYVEPEEDLDGTDPEFDDSTDGLVDRVERRSVAAHARELAERLDALVVFPLFDRPLDPFPPDVIERMATITPAVWARQVWSCRDADTLRDVILMTAGWEAAHEFMTSHVTIAALAGDVACAHDVDVTGGRS